MSFRAAARNLYIVEPQDRLVYRSLLGRDDNIANAKKRFTQQ
jgi:hypothetical protein